MAAHDFRAISGPNFNLTRVSIADVGGKATRVTVAMAVS